MIKKKFNYRHIVLGCFVLLSLFFSYYVFRSAFVRFVESITDLGESCVYYFKSLFLNKKYLDNPSVCELSLVDYSLPFNLPNTWEEFTDRFSIFFDVFFDSAVFNDYLESLSLVFYNISNVILILLPFVLLLIVFFKKIILRENNNYNQDTKPLKCYKRFKVKVCVPIKNWFKSFFEFWKKNNLYTKILIFIWAYNFNLFTVVIEFVAYYLYFICSLDFIGIFRQLYKLLFDLSPMFDFVPVPIWLVVGFVLLDKFRKKIGYRRLNHMEMKNRGFINSLPLAVMGCGSMGADKTTMISDMGLSTQIMFRDKALEKLIENDLKFPNFPWINLENALKSAIEKHLVFNLATTKTFIAFLKTCSTCDNLSVKKSIRRYLKKNGIYLGKNFFFDYDYERYGLTYNDNLKIVDLWEVIKDYSLLYFFYIIESSLIVSNYSVRTDNILESVGNFPLWDNELFKRDTRLQNELSRYSHILDFDMLRLGKKVLKDNPYSDLFEFGIVLCTEVGKERGNMPENVNKKKGDENANPKNDLFDKKLKMIRHAGTIDNTSFVRVFFDEQRPESLGADAREIANILHLKDKSELRLTMPFFFVGEFLYSFIFSKFENLYIKYRFNRGDNTLFMYLIKNIVAKFHGYYKRIYNRFGYMTKSILIENGTQDGIMQEHDYYLLVQKIYSKRFSTDCHSGFFHKKALLSNYGIEDLPSFAGITATAEELKQEHSYFINDLNSGLEEFEKI